MKQRLAFVLTLLMLSSSQVSDAKTAATKLDCGKQII